MSFLQRPTWHVDDGATESVSRSSRDNREMEPSSYATSQGRKRLFESLSCRATLRL